MKTNWDKTIVVSGAGAGIGLSAVEQFAKKGAQVIAVDRDPRTLEQVRFKYSNVTPLVLDVIDAQAINNAICDLGEANILFNCAGVVVDGTAENTSREDWELSLAVNVTGTFNMVQAVLPSMLARNDGTIINMASIVSSKKGLPNRFAYGTSKAAVIGMTKSIAADYVSKGIRCNAICPGTVDTPSLRQRLRDTGDYDSAMKEFVARQPMGRLASAEEIAAFAVFLASDAARFMTGQAIAVDGGISI